MDKQGRQQKLKHYISIIYIFNSKKVMDIDFLSQKINRETEIFTSNDSICHI